MSLKYFAAFTLFFIFIYAWIQLTLKATSNGLTKY